jgi:hypothetical protein
MTVLFYEGKMGFIKRLLSFGIHTFTVLFWKGGSMKQDLSSLSQ